MFVKEYLIDLNATQAAIRAGYSKHTAHAIGQENLSKPIIAEALKKAQEKRNERLDIDADWVLREAVDAVNIFKKSESPALVSAVTLVGKLSQVDAFAADKVNHSGNIGNVPPIDLSAAKAIDDQAESEY